MSLLSVAIATHPDATPAALAAVTDNPGRNTNDAALNAWLLAHPATPVPHGRARTQPVSLTLALSSPLLADTSRARVLVNATRSDLLTYLRFNADAHPAVHTEIHRRCLRVNRGRTEAYTTLLLHPTVPVDIHLAATEHLLGAPLATGHWTQSLLTHAIAHPEHLAALATNTRAAAPGNAWVADELDRYAHIHASAGSARSARLTELHRSARTTGDWATCVRTCADAALALTAVTRSPLSALSAVVSSPDLAATPIAFWERTRTVVDYDLSRADAAVLAQVAAELDALDTTRTYTQLDADIARVTRGAATTYLVSTLSDMPPHADPGHIAAIARAACAQLNHYRYSWDSTSVFGLATHPHTPLPERHQMAAALANAGDTTNWRTVTRLVATPEPTLTSALLNTRLGALPSTASFATVRDNLAHHLAPALRPHLNNGPALAAMLALEPTFTGTLRELIDTATTLAS